VKTLVICAILATASFVLGRETSTTAVHGDAPEGGRYSLFRTDADTNFYDRGVFFIDSASGAVYRYDWDKKQLVEVPKVRATP